MESVLFHKNKLGCHWSQTRHVRVTWSQELILYIFHRQSRRLSGSQRGLLYQTTNKTLTKNRKQTMNNRNKKWCANINRTTRRWDSAQDKALSDKREIKVQQQEFVWQKTSLLLHEWKTMPTNVFIHRNTCRKTNLCKKKYQLPDEHMLSCWFKCQLYNSQRFCLRLITNHFHEFAVN